MILVVLNMNLKAFKSMKNIILFCFVGALFVGCGEDEVKQSGSLIVQVSYEANQGVLPDAGATVYVFEPVGGLYIFEGSLSDWRIGNISDNEGNGLTPVFEGVTDDTGFSILDGLPYGKYQIVVASNAYITYSRYNITIDAPSMSVTKVFDGEYALQDRSEPW